MNVEALVAEHQPENTLPDQRLNKMLDVALVTPIHEALRKSPYQPKTAVHLSQQQRAGVRRDRSAIELRHNNSPTNGFKLQPFWRTLRLYPGAPRIDKKSLLNNNLR